MLMFLHSNAYIGFDIVFDKKLEDEYMRTIETLAYERID